MTRPISVSIISWFYITYSVVTLLPKIFILVSPEAYAGLEELMAVHNHNELVSVSLWFQILFSYLTSLVLAVAGILMLKGYEWGRSLMAIWLLGASLLTLLVAGFSLPFYVKTTFAVIVIILLFRPKANEYFKGDEVVNA
ncbi:MAG: hypothetical protein ABFS18_02460 [Thermodesulfobacteriota bacterium]